MTTLGVDIGTATLTVTLAQDRDVAVMDVDRRPAVPTVLSESEEGLHIAAAGDVVAITEPLNSLRTRTLRTPDGHHYSFPTILKALLAPWIDQLPHLGVEKPDLLVGVHPQWWPAAWRDQYRRALQQHANAAETISEPTAVALGIDDHPDDSVAVWDFGKSHAAVTVVGPKRGGVRDVRDHAFTPDGGAAGVDAYLCRRFGWNTTAGTASEATRLRRAIATAGSNAVDIPVPAGDGQDQVISAREGIDLIAEHVDQVASAMRERVQIDAARHHVAIGGMSQDKGIQSALRQYGHLHVAEYPETILARGAAQWGARR